MTWNLLDEGRESFQGKQEQLVQRARGKKLLGKFEKHKEGLCSWSTGNKCRVARKEAGQSRDQII